MPPGLPRLFNHVLTLTRHRRAVLAVSKSVAILSAEFTARRLQENPPDLLLRPDLGPMPVMEMDRLAEAIAIGERMAEERLPEIRRLLQGKANSEG